MTVARMMSARRAPVPRGTRTASNTAVPDPAASLVAHPTRPVASLRGPARQGLGLLAALMALALGWDAWAPLRGADSLAGAVVIRGGHHVVAHPTGGLVTALHVAEGDAVVAGAPLLRLRDPGLEADLLRLAGQLAQTTAQIDRLRAQLDDDRRAGPPALLPLGDPAISAAQARDATEAARFGAEADGARRSARALSAQDRAVADQLALILAELADQSLLFERGLTHAARVAALGREAARLRGMAADIAATRARLEAQAAVAEAEATRIAASRAADLHEALIAATARRQDLALTQDALLARAAGLVLTAPVDGRVARLAVAGPGAMLGAGAPALGIVPDAGRRAIAVAVPSARIAALADRLVAGQAVWLIPDGPPPDGGTGAVPGTILSVAPAMTRLASTGDDGAAGPLALAILIAPQAEGALPARMPVGAPVRVVLSGRPQDGGALAVVGATLQAALARR